MRDGQTSTCSGSRDGSPSLCLRDPAEEYEALVELIDWSARALRGRVIWNVNSTARGGGVAELLRPLLGYSRGAPSTPARR